MAYITSRKRNKKKIWIIVWRDATKGKGREGNREVYCDHHGATNAEERKILLKKYQALEKQKIKDFNVFGSHKDPKEEPIFNIINEYIKHRKDEHETRIASNDRRGISENYLIDIEMTMKIFIRFLRDNKVTLCGALTPHRMIQLRKWLEKQTKKNGECFSSAYINKIIRNVKAFLNYFKLEERPVFEDPDKLISSLQNIRSNEELPFHFSVLELQRIFREALKFDTELVQTSSQKSKTLNDEPHLKNHPIFPMLILITLTGMRRGEAQNLTWDRVDLESGNLRVLGVKTGKERLIPLENGTQGIITPSLTQLLRLWKMNTKSSFVLPCPRSDRPSSLKNPVQRFRQRISLPALTFQNLRKNFVSYVVSYGIPPAIAAFWAGHSTAVAERNYLQYAFDRLKGDSIEESMGLSSILEDAIAGYNGEGEYKNLQLTKWIS